MSRTLPIVSARAAALLATVMLVAASGPSTAQTPQRRPDQDRARDAVREGSLAPLSQVLATIAARTPNPLGSLGPARPDHDFEAARDGAW